MRNSPDSPARLEDSNDESDIEDSKPPVRPDIPEDISKLTKRELLDLIPDEVKETTTLDQLKRLTKQELIALIDSILIQQ